MFCGVCLHECAFKSWKTLAKQCRPPRKLRNEEQAGTHTRAGWIGTRDGLEADELRPGYMLVRARVRLSGYGGRRTMALFVRDGFRKMGLKPIFVK